MERKRIFWLGMHVVLTQTELPRLRQLGYEVFHPPYLSSIQDQSAVLSWQPEASTLPPAVWQRLASTNFFYNPIPADVAKLLNEHFDAAVVTINPQWLRNFLQAYVGPVIYRVYGQPSSLSRELVGLGALPLIFNREHFWFSPHTEHTLDIEEEWLLERMRVVPYCLAPDVDPLRGTWNLDESRQMIGLLCPRAADIPYYSEHYRFLNTNFPGAGYEIFGGQIVPLQDSRVVGTLDREAFLVRFRSLRGFAYHYTDPTVCYLPPFEFMSMGGPVIFQAGSLLARYFQDKFSPGMAKDTAHLQQLCKRLQSNDRSFIDDVVSSQREVCRLYDPGYVWPLFDQAFREMLDATATPGLLPHLASDSSPISFPAKDAPPADCTVVLLHSLVQADCKFCCVSDGEHLVTEAMCVARRIVRSLVASGKRVVVTALRAELIAVRNFLDLEAERSDQLVLWCIDDGPPPPPLPASRKSRRRTLRDITRPLRRSLGRLLAKGRRGRGLPAETVGSRRDEPLSKSDWARYVNKLNAEPSITRVIVPDVAIFPEVSRFQGKTLFIQYRRPDDLESGFPAVSPDVHWFTFGASAGLITGAAQPLRALPPDDPAFSKNMLGFLGFGN